MNRNLRLYTLSLSSALAVAIAAWQVYVTKEQNVVMSEQSSQLGEQVSLQRAALRKESTRFEGRRRLELLAMLYEVQNCGEDLPALNCPPVASSRTRQEALKELLEIEPSLDLSRARLDGMELSNMDLTHVRLEGARLSGASISFSDLSGVDLSGANLSAANFIGCKFVGADLLYADLTGTNLVTAQLTGADLSGSVLRQARGLWTATLEDAVLDGADLTGIVGLKQEELERALGNKLTTLPPNVAMPIAWSKRRAPASRSAEREYYESRKVFRSIKQNLERLGAHNSTAPADQKASLSGR